MKIYLASNFDLIPKIKTIVSKLEAEGHTIIVRWWERAGLKKQFMVLPPDEFYAEPECKYAFNRDMEGIYEADCLLFVAADTPGYFTGANIEIGIAFGMGKPVFSIGALINSAMYWGVVRYDRVEDFIKAQQKGDYVT